LAEFGVVNLELFRSTLKQMNDSNYASGANPDDVLLYLQDAVDGKKVGKTAQQMRDARQTQLAQAAKDREAKLIKDLPKYRIAASCLSPADGYVETLMTILSSSPTQFVNAVLAQSRFCQVMNESITDVAVVKSARLVARGNDGTEYYVSRTANKLATVGIAKRP
jgi:hypothetical protein